VCSDSDMTVHTLRGCGVVVKCAPTHGLIQELHWQGDIRYILNPLGALGYELRYIMTTRKPNTPRRSHMRVSWDL
jgi:hypothetical protein